MAAGFYRTFKELSALLTPMVKMLHGASDIIRDEDPARMAAANPQGSSRYALNKWTLPIMEAKLCMCVPALVLQIVIAARCDAVLTRTPPRTRVHFPTLTRR